jgi:hypothetical protein
VSTRTAWNPHPFLEIGLDLIWNHVQTANFGSIVNLLPSAGRPGGLYTVANQDNYFVMMRFQRNILPDGVLRCMPLQEPRRSSAGVFRGRDPDEIGKRTC